MGGWGATWALALLGTLALGAATELAWRRGGARPSHSASRLRWARARRQAARLGPEGVVLVGASRIEAGFDPAVFRARYPGRPLVSLAIPGKSGGAVFRDLAADEGFAGTILWSATVEHLESIRWDQSAAHVAFYHREAPGTLELEMAAVDFVEARLAMAHPWRRLHSVRWWLSERGTLPYDFHSYLDAERFRALDLLEQEASNEQARAWLEARRRRIAPPASPEAFRADLAPLEADVRRLQSRGGRACFLRFPDEEELTRVLMAEGAAKPFWDFAAAGSAATWVHFADHPGLMQVPLHDGGHVDMRDRAGFTEALLDVLEGEGVLGGAAATPPSAPSGTSPRRRP